MDRNVSKIRRQLKMQDKQTKTKLGLIVSILSRYQIEPPNELLTNEAIQDRFLSRLDFSSRIKKTRVETLILHSLKMEAKSEIKKKDKTFLVKANIKEYSSPDIPLPNWDDIASFLGMDVDEVKVICCLPGAKFYSSPEWKYIRYHTIKRLGQNCQCCGTGVNNGVPIHVDHILPRSIYPEHALNISNMQILCADCNLAKSNIDTTDWRS